MLRDVRNGRFSSSDAERPTPGWSVIREVFSRHGLRTSKSSSDGDTAARVVASIGGTLIGQNRLEFQGRSTHRCFILVIWELNLNTCRGFVSIYLYSRKKLFLVKLTYFTFMSPKRTGAQRRPPGSGLFALLKPYRQLVAILVVLTIAGNGLTLVVPKLISRAID